MCELDINKITYKIFYIYSAGIPRQWLVEFNFVRPSVHCSDIINEEQLTFDFYF